MKFKDLLTQESVRNFKQSVSEEEKKLFKESIGKVKKIKQDKVDTYIKPTESPYANKEKLNSKNNLQKNNAQKQLNKQTAEFHFSDQYEPYLNEKGPVKYVKEGCDSYAAKRLRRGEYQPDLILDLHGLDQQQAKTEIAALLFACEKEHARCVCIVHGLGGRVLKNKVPHWLVQHPDVIAFHQAPLEWGGNGAILVLVQLKDKFVKD